MNRLLPWVGAALACLWCAEMPFAAAPSRDWKRTRTPNFVAVGNAPEKQLRSTLAQLEAFRAALGALFPALSSTGQSSTMVMLLKDMNAFRPFAPLDSRGKRLQDVAGYFTKSPRGDLFVMGSYAESTLQVAFHEYVHAVMHRKLTVIPTWVSEGVAEFYSTFSIDPRTNTATIGAVPEWRRASLSVERWIPLRQIVTSEGASKIMRSRTGVSMFYAESWALVHFLAFSKDGARVPQLATYLSALSAGKPEDVAFENAFGATYAQIDAELRGYIRAPLLYRRVPMDAVPAASAAGGGAIEVMTEAEAEGVQGCLLLHLGSLRDAERHLTAALVDDPKDVPARTCLGTVRVRQDRTAEALAILEPLASEPSVPADASFYLGVALDDAGRTDDAVRAFSRATTAKPDFVSAWFELSVAALSLRREPQARSAFAEVRRLDSDPSWLRARAERAISAGRFEIAVQDVRRYQDERGLQDDGDIYCAFVAVLALRRMGQPKEADALLSDAAAVADPKSWTARVISFLQEKVDAKAFLGAADNNGERTEAHTYIGFIDLEYGRIDAARAHFQWVKDQGSRNYTEYDLALGQLRLLERAAKR